MINETRINGFACGWNDIRFAFDGELFTGATSIQFGHAIEPEFVYESGSHNGPVGQTRGKYTTDPLVIEGPTFLIEELRKYFAQRSPTGIHYGRAIIARAVLQYIQNDDVVTEEFTNVRWIKDTVSHSEGGGPLMTTVEMTFMELIINNMRLASGNE